MELIFLQLLPCTCHRSSRSWAEIRQRVIRSANQLFRSFQSSQRLSALSSRCCSPAQNHHFDVKIENGWRAPRVAAHSNSTVQAGPETRRNTALRGNETSDLVTDLFHSVSWWDSDVTFKKWQCSHVFTQEQALRSLRSLRSLGEGSAVLRRVELNTDGQANSATHL